MYDAIEWKRRWNEASASGVPHAIGVRCCMEMVSSADAGMVCIKHNTAELTLGEVLQAHGLLEVLFPEELGITAERLVG